MDVILHLGGNSERARTAAALAKQRPDSKIVVSSEGGNYMDYYRSEDIDPGRIVIDSAAWDTVTNFTHTYKRLREIGCTRLFVVTDMFHCYRSMLIALAVWGGRVPIYIVPREVSVRESDEGYSAFDFIRAALWRLTGILLYWNDVYKNRKAYITQDTKHSLIDIGI